MTFYIKYRPQTLDELDEAPVRNALKKIIETGNIPHAFLFSGPKGTGKTSAARILAKIVNCESHDEKKRGKGLINPCNECDECTSISKGQNMDVIELDAASHRGIDDVRSLRDAVKLAPARAKKKVYIIDEAHMLTTEASNALLKTLEEPPSHVMFILATTNPEKLIDTIRSRATNILFKKADKKEIISSLQKIAEGEGLKLSKEVLEEISNYGDGSFRDATKIFEQVTTELEELTPENIRKLLSGYRSFNADEFLDNLASKDIKTLLKLINSAVENGASPRDIATAVTEKLRDLLIAKVSAEKTETGFETGELLELSTIFSETSSKMQSAYIEQFPLELAVIRWCSGLKTEKKADNGREASEEKHKAGGPVSGSESQAAKEAVNKDDNNVRNAVRLEHSEKEVTETVKIERTVTITEEKEDKVTLTSEKISDEVWTQILSKVKPGHTSTEALLRAARPLSFDGSTLKLGVYYKFHKEHLESSAHRDILEEALSEYLGSSVRVVCILTEPPAAPQGEVTLAEPRPAETTITAPLTQPDTNDIISIAEKIFSS